MKKKARVRKEKKVIITLPIFIFSYSFGLGKSLGQTKLMYVITTRVSSLSRMNKRVSLSLDQNLKYFPSPSHNNRVAHGTSLNILILPKVVTVSRVFSFYFLFNFEFTCFQKDPNYFAPNKILLEPFVLRIKFFYTSPKKKTKKKKIKGFLRIKFFYAWIQKNKIFFYI